MNDVLADYRRKRARVDFHFESIEEAVKQFAEREADLVPGKFNRDRRQYVFEWPRPHLEPGVALMVGDCVYNLRASLDYLVTALVRSRGNEEDYNTAFPIYVPRAGGSWLDVPDRWQEDSSGDLGRKLRGTPPETKNLLEMLQPFHGVPASDPDEHPLTMLSALGNTDKHRRLNLVASRVDITFLDADGKALFVQPPPHGSISVPEGSTSNTQIVTLRVPSDKREADVYLRPAYEITFDESGPPFHRSVIEALRGIREFIDGQVARTVRLLLGA
jgi:hypothetical protein